MADLIIVIIIIYLIYDYYRELQTGKKMKSKEFIENINSQKKEYENMKKEILEMQKEIIELKAKINKLENQNKEQ